jgi:hypothetical protein
MACLHFGGQFLRIGRGGRSSARDDRIFWHFFQVVEDFFCHFVRGRAILYNADAYIGSFGRENFVGDAALEDGACDLEFSEGFLKWLGLGSWCGTEYAEQA